MSIEDVEFLLQNSKTDSHIVYIDSAKRNKKFYPHPNHYSIKFSHPFKNVYGVEILDASIPATMFNVDVDNNVMSFMQGYNLTSPTMKTMMQELSKLAGFAQMANRGGSSSLSTSSFGVLDAYQVSLTEGDRAADKSKDMFLDPDKLRSYTTPCLNMVQFMIDDDTCDNFLCCSMQTSHKAVKFVRYKMPDIRLFDTPGGLKPPVFKVEVNGDTFYTNDAYFYDFYTIFSTKYHDMSFYDVLFRKSTSPRYARGYVVERVHCDKDTFAWYYYTITPVDVLDPAEPYVALRNMVIEPGNYSATSLLAATTTYLEGTGLRMIADVAARKDGVLQYPYFIFDGDDPFIINASGPASVYKVLGLSEIPNDMFPTHYDNTLPSSDALQLFGAIPGGSAYTLKSPGIINMETTRYSVVRCDELEDHMFGSYSYGDFNPGICLLKFFETNGVSHQRVEYIKFTKPPFHPIGKLDKITLTFLMPDLQARYDFKGCDHLIILCVKTYVPTRHVTRSSEPTRSVLNPNYDPDFKQYFQQYIDYRADNKEQIGLADVDVNTIGALEAEFGYSSGDAESNCDPKNRGGDDDGGADKCDSHDDGSASDDSIDIDEWITHNRTAA